MLSEKIISFYKNLNLDIPLPAGIHVMNPYKNHDVMKITEAFARKYFNDDRPRILMFGINPGRFGAGVTGITFTDPIRLERDCNIPNSFLKKQELSSVFIYEMINRFGGPEKFYSRFFLTAISPLGFVKEGKNLNYYDGKEMEGTVKSFIIQSIRQQLKFGTSRKAAICLGEGKNFRFFSRLNEQQRFFDTIIPLPHPRFIMQYRLKHKEGYILRYLQIFSELKST
jgi:hypothetical protein